MNPAHSEKPESAPVGGAPAEPASLSPPLAPPTTPGPLRIPDRPKVWPTALGVIAIIFGVMGSFSGLWGMIGPLLMGVILSWAPAMGAADSTIKSVGAFTPYLVGLSACATLVSILLVIGGIGLVRLRPWAPAALVWWAALKIVTVIAMTAMQYIVQRAVLDGAAASGSGGGAPARMIGGAAMLVGVVIGLAWGWALPIFVLIWLRRPSVRDDIASWRRRAKA